MHNQLIRLIVSYVILLIRMNVIKKVRLINTGKEYTYIYITIIKRLLLTTEGAFVALTEVSSDIVRQFYTRTIQLKTA